MKKLAQFKHFLKSSLWTIDLDAVSAGQRLTMQALRLVMAVGLEFRHQLLDVRAASLVYTTLLSLVPVLAVMFSVLKAFGIHYQIEPFLAQALAPLGPKGQEVTVLIVSFMENLQVGVLGIVGIAGLFYTSYALIDRVEQTFNAIWRVQRGRPWTRKFTDYLSVVLVGPLLIVTALGLIASVQSHTFVQQVLTIQPLGFLVVWAAKFVPFLLLCGVFTFLYAFLPYTEVRFVSALVGGVTTALLWGLAGEAFAKFVAESANYNAIYSGFALLLLFLLWLYVGWLIVLLGAQVSFLHQYPAAYQSRLLWQSCTHVFRERLVLTLLAMVTRRYLQGDRPYREQALAAEINLPLSIVQKQIVQLVEQGILCRMTEPQGVGLVKPPELVSVREVLDALRGQGASGPRLPEPWSDAVTALLQRRDEAASQALSEATLRLLVSQDVLSPRQC